MENRGRSQLYILVALFLFILPSVAVGDGFNRERCLAKVRALLGNGTLNSNASVFFRDDQGLSMSSMETPTLTVNGCKQICGKSFGWYRDIGPRLSTWLIPVFLLVSNMEVSPLDKRRYWTLIHLLGDPIDSLWSLLTKMEAWARCHHMARRTCRRGGRRTRNLATVFGGFEEIVGFHANPADVYTKIVQGSKLNRTEIDQHVARTAQRLADSRTDERLRTLLATVLYIYQLVSAFITTVGGGNSSPPGGRIGIAMFMTWIIPPILVSNAIGCFTSKRICFDILESFVRHINPQTNLWFELQRTVPELQHQVSVDVFFDSIAWSGAIYSFRPSKRLLYSGGPQDRNRFVLLLLATIPIVVSSIVASIILWHTPPIGINCRNILIFSIAIFILLSTLFTSSMSWLGLRGSRLWHLVLAKDVCIAVPFIVLVFLATSGRFNSCWCWSGSYTLGARAHIPLNALPDFELFDRTTYPILVSVCLTLLLLSLAAMMAAGWRGWNVMRWSEVDRQAEWKRSRVGMGEAKSHQRENGLRQPCP